MKNLKLDTSCLLDTFKEHPEIKDNLMSLIKDAKSETLQNKNEYYGDSIDRLDWSENLNYERPWVKYIKPYIEKQLKKYANYLGYQDALIKGMWFQQYNKEGKHGWHIHCENYTGVYYVDFNNKCAKTEVINPLFNDKKFTINATEGDIVIFPSFVIHRAPAQKTTDEKLIISFNLDFQDIDPNLFSKIDNLKSKGMINYEI